ncbi:proteasome regulatory particle base subunit rpn10 [Dispira simplex]|nr:proteasome regulatory particle base subunit rpn10 [Dispira simplex]
MVLEATVIILDNSDWMRNGDYTPTRFAAQRDAANLIYSTKLQTNPENTVAFLSMAGKSPEMLVTLTADVGKLLVGMHKMTQGGKPNLEAALQIAQLALKHRANKNQRQRIVAFVGSPVDADEKTFVRIAKRLKKNNVAVDFINFGEVTANEAKLDSFIRNINSNDNSHLVTVPPGSHILSDMIRSSPVVAGESAGSGGMGGEEFEFGVDPTLDPELALALRMSMEEEQARQAAASKSTGSADTASATAGEGKAPATLSIDRDVAMGEANEDEELARAIALSMETSQPASTEQGSTTSGQQQTTEWVSSVLGSLPGVDPNDPRLQNAMDSDDKPQDSGDASTKAKKKDQAK